MRRIATRGQPSAIDLPSKAAAIELSARFAEVVKVNGIEIREMSER